VLWHKGTRHALKRRATPCRLMPNCVCAGDRRFVIPVSATALSGYACPGVFFVYRNYAVSDLNRTSWAAVAPPPPCRVFADADTIAFPQGDAQQGDAQPRNAGGCISAQEARRQLPALSIAYEAHSIIFPSSRVAARHVWHAICNAAGVCAAACAT
jgi:hypothetical protein